jgi:hypothetical protein
MYPAGRIVAPSSGYPGGSFRNETTPDVSDDGTPLDNQFGDELLGFLGRLLVKGLITESGALDTAQASDYFDAMAKVMADYSSAGFVYEDTGVANAYILGVKDERLPITELKDGMVFEFVPANSNTGASTANVAGSGIKDILDLDGGVLVSGELPAGVTARIRYTLGDNKFRLEPRASSSAAANAAAIRDALGRLAGDITGNAETLGGSSKTFYTNSGNQVSGTLPPARLPGATTSSLGGVEKATKTEMEAESSGKYPDAAVLKNHPGVAKAYVNFEGTTGAINSSHNVSSVTRVATGHYTVNLSVTMSGSYTAVADVQNDSSTGRAAGTDELNPTNFRLFSRRLTDAAKQDTAFTKVVVYGDIA